MTEPSTAATSGEPTATTRRPPATSGTAPSAPSGAIVTPQRAAKLTTEHGTTVIADGVVAKIAGLAAREIPGVYNMGKGMGRTFGNYVYGETAVGVILSGGNVNLDQLKGKRWN